MSSLAGVTSLNQSAAMANPATAASMAGMPGMPADTFQQAYSGIQQYVGEAVMLMHQNSLPIKCIGLHVVCQLLVHFVLSKCFNKKVSVTFHCFVCFSCV